MCDEARKGEMHELVARLEAAGTRREVMAIYVKYAQSQESSVGRLAEVEEQLAALNKEREALTTADWSGRMYSVRGVAAERLLKLELGEEDD